MNISLPARKKLFKDKVYLTIGVFDGVHLGHQKIIGSLVRAARRHNAKAVVMTFIPHPASVVQPRKAPPLLLSLTHRLKLLADTGVDSVFVVKFDKALADVLQDRFMREVVSGVFNAKELLVGEDFRLGKDGKRGSRELCESGRLNGVKVRLIKNKKMNGRVVSSTLIRDLVVNGKFGTASRLLGRPYSLLGTVVHGDQIGRILGFPTANLNLHHEAEPPLGVYPVFVRLDKKIFRGVMNIGFRPTLFSGALQKRFEVHMFDFHGKIYGKDLEVFPLKRIRREQKFKDHEHLVARIKQDADRAAGILGKIPLSIKKSTYK